MVDQEIVKQQLITELKSLQQKVSIIEDRQLLNESLPKGSREALDNHTLFNLLPNKRSVKFYYKIFFFTFSILLLFTAFEFAKILMFPNLQPFESIVVSLMFLGIIIFSAAFIVNKKLENLNKEIKEQIFKKSNIENKISNINVDLERRVKDRTAQIWETNTLLKKEIIRRQKAEVGINNYNSELLVSKKNLENKALELAKLNAALVKSEKELKEINASKDKFFSILAHDLRSPFSSLVGLSDYLESELENLNDDEIKKIAHSISHSSLRVNRLLDNLLQWSQVHTGRIEFDPVPINIGNLITEIEELFIANAEGKRIFLTHKFSHMELVFADRNMINSVIRNLISNAIKFTMPEGKIFINTVQQRKFVRISVKDTGIGIDENDMDKIFKIEEHAQIDGTSNEKGTGLGLIICKEFVEKNGGKIWFDSTKNKGTEFFFTLPVAEKTDKALY